MTLTEATAILDRSPTRFYMIRMDLSKGSGVQWSIWDGYIWHSGATLEQAVNVVLEHRGLGTDGTVLSAQASLAG